MSAGASPGKRERWSKPAALKRLKLRRSRLPKAHDGVETERRNWRRFWWVAGPVALLLALALAPLPWQTASTLLIGVVIGALALAWLTVRRLGVLAEEVETLEQENARLLAEIEAREPAIAEVHALQHAVDGLAARDAATRERLATLGHELRTPLSGLQGVLRLLAATRLDAEQADYASALERTADNLRRLTDSLVSVARGQTVEDEPRPVRLGALIGEIVELAAPAAHAKGLDLAGFVAPGLPREVRGLESDLRQILHNLVGNAVKYTGDGGIGVTAEPGDLNGNPALVLTVTDSGIGVAPDERGRMFDAFARADSARDQPGEGIGLGVVARLVQRAAGGIEMSDGAANSRGGRGTRLTVTLPLDPAGETPAVDEGALLGRTLSVVSMRPVTAPLIERALRDRGAKIVGRGADVEIVDLTGRPPSASLANVRPGNDAQRHIALLRPDQRASLDALRANGFDGYLVSPLRPRSLVQRIEAVSAENGETPDEALETVLVIEDDPVNALIASRLVEAAGLEAVRAADWAQARDRLTDGHRAVLLDLDLPDLAGAALLEAARDGLGGTATPLLVVTADRDGPAARQALSDGVSVAQKPLTASVLDDILE